MVVKNNRFENDGYDRLEDNIDKDRVCPTRLSKLAQAAKERYRDEKNTLL